MGKGNSKKVYKSNFIDRVIFRVDFPIILELREQHSPSKLQQEIVDSYPLLEEIKGELIAFELQGTTPSVKKEPKISWKFSNKEKTTFITVDPEFVAIESKEYNNFEEFLDCIKKILGKFVSLYPVKIINRVGLRYINKIVLPTGDPLEWSGYVHSSLFAVPRDMLHPEERVLRSMHSVEVKQENYSLRFQFGLFNSEYPNPIARKEFILDYDCVNSNQQEVSNIFACAQESNDVISDWFERSIEDTLRAMMGTKNE